MNAADAMGDGIDEGRTPDITPDDLLWEHSDERTPYENLRNAYHAMPDDTPRTEIKAFAFRYIKGMGPSITGKALAKIEAEMEQHD